MHWGTYMNHLAAMAGLPPVPAVLDRMFIYAVALVLVEGLTGARKSRFRLNSDKTNFSVTPVGNTVTFVFWVLILLKKIGSRNVIY